MNCDDCKHYHWYYDYCDKWDCEMDARACNSCFEAQETQKNDVVKLLYCEECGRKIEWEDM